MNNNEAKLPLNITANTTEFESAMKRATEAAHAFRTALQALPWYIHWIMAAHRLLDRLFPKRHYADGGLVKPGKPYVVGEVSGCSGGSVSREAGERYFRVGDGITGDADGCMSKLRRYQETAKPVPAYWRNGQE